MTMHIYIYTYTSSTAAGGGTSFKDRKPIQEVGCCDGVDGRANPLMDRKVFEALSLSISPPVCPSVNLFVYLSEGARLRGFVCGRCGCKGKGGNGPCFLKTSFYGPPKISFFMDGLWISG